MQKKQLYYGDNLGVLREHIKDESVDPIYLDPPSAIAELWPTPGQPDREGHGFSRAD